MTDKKEVTVPMDDSLHDAIVDELEYGDSKAGWIREAIRERLKAEGELADDAEPDGGDRTIEV